MGATKYDFYTDELINTAQLLKALAHPARLKAFLMIMKETERDVTSEKINEEIGLSRSTLSVHMKKLTDSGLIKSAVTTTKLNTTCISYRLNKPALSHLVQMFNHCESYNNKKEDLQFATIKQFYTALKSTDGWNKCYLC